MADQMLSASGSAERLVDAWRALRRTSPHVRARDAAAQLGVTEVELIDARTGSGEAVRLSAEPARLLAEIPALGPVMALSRSRDAVLECDGAYGPPDIGEHTGIVLGDNIDLRIFPSGWKFAYAVSETTERGSLRSVQVFDSAGVAVHKIYLRPASDVRAFDELARRLATGDAGSPPRPQAARPASNVDDASVDLAAYRAAFAAMTDTHDFFMLLRRFGLAREQGLRLAEASFVRRVARDAHRQVFSLAAAERIPLMLFVANDGIVQISSGPIPQPVISGSWCNLLDKRFNLHLAEDGIARAWAVRKPTRSGIVTSLELYAADGSLSLQIFGERHEGAGERPDWARAMNELA